MNKLASDETLATGGCLCGAIRYEISAFTDGIYNVICHCRNCKKASGGQFNCASIYEREHFKVIKGTPKQYFDEHTDSGTPLIRNFCQNCGSNLFATTDAVPKIVSIFSGSLDIGFGESWVPNKEQYLLDKSAWIPEFKLVAKDGLQPKHDRGPLKLEKQK